MSDPPFKVKAVFEYTSQHDDDLHFPDGQIINVTAEEDEDWYSGNYVDDGGVMQEGIFPKNFVEKYEPTAPPRPTRASRSKKETEVTSDVSVEPATVVAEPKLAHEAPSVRENQQSTQHSSIPSVPTPANHLKVSRSSALNSIPAPLELSHLQSSEKSTGNSFKDRIAAFNKAASPVTPFKPSGLSSSFVKKPFVAPPPSKNAYVPIPRDQLTPKAFRREEDHELMKARETEIHETVEKVDAAPSLNKVDEDEPKPTSLKERIALLQKQQLEQASRLADAAHKKERIRRPVTKHVESGTHIELSEDADVVSLERGEASENIEKISIDSVRDEPNLVRKHTHGPGDDPTESEKNENVEIPRNNIMAQTKIEYQDTDARDDSAVENESNNQDDNEEYEIDPEIRRKEELRARMAKMSGGMGMHGIFGPPGGIPMPIMIAPAKKKGGNTSERYSEEPKTDNIHTPPSPVIVAPATLDAVTPTKAQESARNEVKNVVPAAILSENRPSLEDTRAAHEYSQINPVISHDGGAPPIPGGRPPISTPQDLCPVVVPMSPTTGSESDDELSSGMQDQNFKSTAVHYPRSSLEQDGPSSPKSAHSRLDSFTGTDQPFPTSPIASVANKRISRPPPPIPSGFVSSLPQARAPPPPPPVANNWSSTNEQPPHQVDAVAIASEESEEITEYEGDYDTDTISTALQKDALQGPTRNKGIEDDHSLPSPALAPTIDPFPLPSSPALRGYPAMPLKSAPEIRSSLDMPRSAPPPPPNGVSSPRECVDEYDPYRYTGPKKRAPSVPSIAGVTPIFDSPENDLYSASPPKSPYGLQERKPQLPPRDYASPSGNRPPPRSSVDVARSATVTRRSVDLSRISLDYGFVANDVDLAPKSFWWVQNNGTPPAFQGRKDILFESDEIPSSKNGKVMVTKELYVLFQDYSQTIISAHFDPQNPADVTLEQRHEQPPSRLRQDQLEQAHERLGRSIFEGVTARRDTVVGDGTPQGLVTELLKPLSNALLPIGTRAYGALVYGNIANASTQQNDEIRPGDLITIRNAKFQGKHGPLNAKYSMEVGKPDHVAVVAEWDGTKKKIRAWEQGRESKKVKLESFKLDDLRSGEVKIWRVMPRSWVGWEGQN